MGSQEQLEQLELEMANNPDEETQLKLQELESLDDSSVQASVVFFGYGIIDFRRDLCIRGQLGVGNFGTVNLAVCSSCVPSLGLECAVVGIAQEGTAASKNGGCQRAHQCKASIACLLILSSFLCSLGGS